MNRNKGLLLILATAFISGLSIFINKFGVSIINPYIFTGLKNIIVVVLIIGWLLAMKDWTLLKNLSQKQWLTLLGIGLIGGSIPFLLFFKGLSMTSAVQAVFIHKTMFIYVAVFAVVFLKEKIGKNFLIGGLLLLLGNILLLKMLPHQFGLGDLLVFIATLFWAGENILSKYLLKELPSRIVIWGRMFFGSIFIMIFWLMTGQAYLAASLNLEQLGWLMIVSVFLLGYVATWYTGLKYVKVSVAAAILLLSTPITVLLSLAILGESILISQILGMFLIGMAVFLIFKSIPKLCLKIQD